MQFLNPIVWLGALALAVPVLLHLFQRERKTSLSFASLMFLKRLPVKETRRRRLRHLLLLAIRCLALLLVVAAFARPVVRGDWLSRVNPLAARSTVILIDRSMSVSQTRVWQQALDAARSKIGSMGQDDEAKIIQFGESIEVLNDWETVPEQLLQVLADQVSPSYEGTAYAEALRAATEELQEGRRNGRPEIYLITDLQREGLSSERDWKAPPEITVELVDVGADLTNVYIRQVSLDRDVFGARYPNPISVRLATHPARKTEGEIELRLQDKVHDRRSFKTDAQGSATVTFDPFELEDGQTRGRFVLTAEDELSPDDSYSFVMERRTPRQVAVLTDSAGKGFYVERALDVGENLSYRTVPIKRGDVAGLDPSETPLLVLADVRNLPAASGVRDYLAAGGNLIVALGARIRPADFDKAWVDLLPAHPSERVFVRSGNRTFTSMTEIAWEHPIFAVFQDVYRNAIVNTRFFSYWKLSPKDDAVIFARLSGGHPMMVESPPADSGRILVLASGIDTTWSDFPLRAAFVPFWHSAIQHATGWSSRPAAGGINRTLPLDAFSAEERSQGSAGDLAVISPTGRRLLTLDDGPRDSLLLTEPGHYEIRSKKTTTWTAVNVSPFESDLQRMPRDDFLARFVPQQSRPIETAAVEEKTKEEERSQALWWICLLLAAGLFLLEGWLANRTASRNPLPVAPA